MDPKEGEASTIDCHLVLLLGLLATALSNVTPFALRYTKRLSLFFSSDSSGDLMVTNRKSVFLISILIFTFLNYKIYFL
ncbi:hypothetical protein D3C86_1149350 [compost metagenome]